VDLAVAVVVEPVAVHAVGQLRVDVAVAIALVAGGGGTATGEGTGTRPAGVGDAQAGGVDARFVQEAATVGDVDAALLPGRVHGGRRPEEPRIDARRRGVAAVGDRGRHLDPGGLAARAQGQRQR